MLNRGVGRRLLFTKDEDFLAFERVVEVTLRTRRMRLCADCLMPNLWHFVVWPEWDGDLPAFMQQVTDTHVKRWKKHRQEIGYGHLYQGRYKCFPVETEDYFSTRSFATWSGRPCVQTSGSERNRGVGRVYAVWSAKTRRFPSSRRGLCHAPPIGCKLSTNLFFPIRSWHLFRLLAPCIRADRVTLSGKHQSGPSSMVIDCRLSDELSSVPP